MALPEKLALEIDYPQTRIKNDAQTVLAQCSYDGVRRRAVGWEPSMLSDCWQDPVTLSLWLTPAPRLPGWNTTGTGIYARTRASSLTFTTPASWTEVVQSEQNSGDYWQSASGLTADETAILNSAYAAKNQPVYLAWFGFNGSAQRYVVLECGWNDTAGLTGGVGLRFWSDDEVEVWKDGALKASYRLGGDNAQTAAQQQFQNVLLVPCRKRELLVVSGTNTGFSHAFDDLDETEDEPEIVAATKFWVTFPVSSGNRSGMFQLAPVQFQSTGYAVSTLLAFPDAPVVGQPGPTFTQYDDLYGKTVTPELKKEDGTTAFALWNPDDPGSPETRKCRIKVTLTGGTRTPFVYGVLAEYLGIVTETADGTFDLMTQGADGAGHVTEAVLTVGETASSVSLGFTLARVETLEALAESNGSPGINLRDQSNRPLKAKFGDSALIMGGRTGPGKWNPAAYFDAGLLVMEARDRWKALENYRFRDVVPLDGLSFVEALKKVVSPAFGIEPDRYDIEDTDFDIPKNSAPTVGEWTCAIEPGDNAASWVERLMDNYAADWFYGFVPKADKTQFVAKSIAGMDNTPSVTVFQTAAEGIAEMIGRGMGIEEAERYMQFATVRNYRLARIDPEATEVRVTGWDPRNAVPIVALKVDRDAEDPQKPVPDRPANWLGEKRVYGWVDTAINSLDLATRCCERLYKKLTVVREMVEWECGLLQKPDGSLVWRGDVVRIDGLGDYRVTALKCDFVKEPDWDAQIGGAPDGMGPKVWRPATYTGEKVGDVPEDDAYRGSMPFADLERIVRALAERPPDMLRASRGSDFLLKRTPGNVTKL